MAHQATVFVLAAALLCGAAAGNAITHPGHHSPAFLKYRHNVHHAHHASTEDRMRAEMNAEVAAELEELPPLTLPGRHPTVEKALDGMSGDLENLRDQKLAAKVSRGELESKITEATTHMTDATAIKHAISEKQAQLRGQDGKLKKLENDAGRLDMTREGLMSSLHRMLDPKIMKAQVRFEKKERALHKEEEATKAWGEKKDQLKDGAMQLIEQKKASHASLLQAEEEIAQAKKHEELARIQYQHDSSATAEKVQSYRYAETRFKAEHEHEEAASAAAAEAHDSVKKLYDVANVEQEKVDRSILYRKDRLRNQMKSVEAAREKSNNDMNDLTQKYRQQEEQQRERKAEIAKKKEETKAAEVAYGARQQQVLDSAEAKATKSAEVVGDWDGWGADDSMVHDELDDF